MVSNTFTLVFAISSIVILLTMMIILIIFLRKSYLSRTVRVMIIGKDRAIKPYRIKNIGKTFDIGDMTYTYDPSFEVKRRFWKEIYYLQNIPLPVNWWEYGNKEKAKLKVGKIILSGINLKNIAQEKLMNNVLKRKDDTPMVLFMIVIIVLVGVSLFLQWKGMQGVSLADTPENKALILKWLTGGQ